MACNKINTGWIRFLDALNIIVDLINHAGIVYLTNGTLSKAYSLTFMRTIVGQQKFFAEPTRSR